MKQFIILLTLFLGGTFSCFSQNSDSARRANENKAQTYFIITAGTQITAYYNDKPVEVETIDEFNDYVQKNAKILKNASVVVTGKPKVGTFDSVIKTLSRFKIKNVTKEISKD
ncbi:MAG TPA: hypothetical protein VK711_10585 [Puia sp.]|jgi:hypothetical protein|nr:hypothetical protein [Puia sp.]